MKRKMAMVQSDLLREFTDVAFGESARVRWQASQQAEANNIDEGPAAQTDSQNDLFLASQHPF
jgi:hypothetical protein